MNKFKISIFLLSVFVLFVSSCTHKDNTEIITPQQNDSACDPNTVYYVNDIQPLLNSSCAYSGCHDVVSHQEGVILTTYDKVISTGEVKAGNPSGSEIYEKIQEGEMPPSNPLSAYQQQLIFDWITQGAKNNRCVESCDTTNISYAMHIKPTIENNCTGCHSGSSPAGGISISNYNELKAIASNGSLIGTIEHKSGYSPMPKGMTKLSDCQIKQINIWINDGMQNN